MDKNVKINYSDFRKNCRLIYVANIKMRGSYYCDTEPVTQIKPHNYFLIYSI